MATEFLKRFEERQLNMFNFDKKNRIQKPEPTKQEFEAFLDAIKMENLAIANQIINKYDSSLLSMHDHVHPHKFYLTK